jgi:cytochrome c553
MSTQNPQDQLLGFAMKELSKVLQDLKEGKQPEMSSSMEKLASELEMATEKKKNMTEEEIKNWAQRIAAEVSKLED